MDIGVITCSYFMRIYGYRKPEDFDWGKMTAKYRAEFSRADFVELAKEIRSLGYEGIEIWEPNFSHMVYTEEEASTMAEELKGMGYRKVVYCIGGWGPSDKGQVEKAYRFAKALGAQVVTGCLIKEGCGELTEEMERCGKLYGIKYAVENHPAPNYEKPEDVAELISRYETIGANVDSGIYNMQGYDVLGAADLFGDKIYHVHFKDTFVGGEGCMPIGEGDAPMKELLLKLRDKNYGGMVSVEFEFEGDPVPGLKTSIDFMKKTLA